MKSPYNEECSAPNLVINPMHEERMDGLRKEITNALHNAIPEDSNFEDAVKVMMICFQSREREYGVRIKNLIDALEDMYLQYCDQGHAFMSAGERAMTVLEREKQSLMSFDEIGRPSLPNNHQSS